MIFEIYTLNHCGVPNIRPLGRYTGNIVDVVKSLEKKYGNKAFHIKECKVENIKEMTYDNESEIMIEFADKYLLHNLAGDFNTRRSMGLIEFNFNHDTGIAEIENISDETVLKEIKKNLDSKQLSVLNRLINRVKSNG